VRHRPRRRISCAFGEKEGCCDLRCVPGDFAAIGHFADPQAYAREHIIERQGRMTGALAKRQPSNSAASHNDFTHRTVITR